tara:strand:+ start:71 stop:235 length:165 start_codon:yes stop_codon:yes gene_type:complete
MIKELIANNYNYFDNDDMKYKKGSLYKVDTGYTKGYLFISNEGFYYPLVNKRSK